MTGRYPHSNGLMGLVNLGWRLPDCETTLPQILRRNGYHTALFGIQHERPSSEAKSLGYELAIPVAPVSQLAAKVAAYLEARPSQPFFFSIGTLEPHRPFRAQPLPPESTTLVPPYLPDHRIVREEMAGFVGLVERLDRAVGEVLGALDGSGLSESTLVVFTTDHGIDMPRAKGTLYDPGIETALTMRWPGVVPPGARFGDLLSNVDLLPTILEAVGVEVPGSVQGRSFWPLVVGGRYAPRDAIYAEKTHHTAYDPMRCIRTRTHKYIHNFGALRHHEIPADGEMDCLAAVPELCRQRRPLEELYDLRSDPLEVHNLAKTGANAPVIAELKQRLRSWMEQTDDSLLEGLLHLPKFL
jgi:arylsulfatase A-like enzyme